MLPYYIEEETKNVCVEEKDIVQANYKNCIKCFVELNPDNYIESRKICRSCHNKSRKKWSVK